MSRAAATTRRTGERTAPAVVQSPPVRRVTVRWTIAADALPERFRPVATGQDAVLELSIESAGESTTADARLRAGGRERSIDLGPRSTVAWRRDPDNGLEHIDMDGVAAITVRRSARGGVQLAYAASPLLARLGIAGGRYEASEARIIER